MGKSGSGRGDLGLAILWIIGGAIAFALMLGVVQQLMFGRPTEMESGAGGRFQTWEQPDAEETAAGAISDPRAPAVTARAAVVMDLVSGRVLYEKQSSVRVYPASTTKIMTALLGIEYGDLKRDVTVSGEAIGVEGSSIYLKSGEIISMEDLLYGAMLRSGNDAATAIALEIGGSVDAFVELMNRRAVELGAVHTHFANPTGLHQEDHYTTAYDMALMARAAMQNPTFSAIAGTARWTADRQEGRDPYFYNKNKVVHQYEGGTGVKIGYTKTSGRTLVASSRRDGKQLICVVMDAPDWFNDAYRLMDYCYETCESVTAVKGNQRLERVPVEGGTRETVWIGVREDVTVLVRKEERENVAVAYAVTRPVKAPVRRGTEAGQLHVYAAGQYVYSVPLYFLEDVDKER